MLICLKINKSMQNNNNKESCLSVLFGILFLMYIEGFLYLWDYDRPMQRCGINHVQISDYQLIRIFRIIV